MENIRQALERSREPKVGHAEQKEYIQTHPPRPLSDTDAAVAGLGVTQKREIMLNAAHLESKRIIAHDETDPRSKTFDMLRTQVLQSMDQKNWNILGITSPSPGCGKTLTAINLALSIARRPERSALLVDLDLQKPQDANYLGVNCECGVVSVLEGRASLSDAIIPTRIGNCQMLILPAEGTTLDSSARMSSRALGTMIQELKRDFRSHTVILDLPPMLSTDDVISIMPQLDCVLLVAAVGRTKISEIEECNKHLRSTEVLRIVLNKVPNFNAEYYSYYGSRP